MSFIYLYKKNKFLDRNRLNAKKLIYTTQKMHRETHFLFLWEEKKKFVRFNFSVPPMFWIPNQLEGAYVGQDVTLECHSEAFPPSINYWEKEDGHTLVSGR